MEQKLYEVLCRFIEHLTKDYLWYYDTPEQRFEWSPESIWLIKPETKEWALELQKDGKLWWNIDFFLSFKRYFNMERSDFESFIKVWMEDVLNRGVSTTSDKRWTLDEGMEDVLNRGVSTTLFQSNYRAGLMEDVLNRGVSTTNGLQIIAFVWMEDVLNIGKTI